MGIAAQQLPSPKIAEQNRRCGHIQNVEVRFDIDGTFVLKADEFLASSRNKAELIDAMRNTAHLR